MSFIWYPINYAVLAHHVVISLILTESSQCQVLQEEGKKSDRF